MNQFEWDKVNKIFQRVFRIYKILNKKRKKNKTRKFSVFRWIVWDFHGGDTHHAVALTNNNDDGGRKSYFYGPSIIGRDLQMKGWYIYQWGFIETTQA